MPIYEIVFLAIQAGVRLYAAGRKAYVDSTRDRSLILPLPRAPELDFSTIKFWFSNDPGSKIKQENPRISWLLEKTSRSPQEDMELRQLYSLYYDENNPTESEGKAGEASITGKELSVILEIRQWSATEDPGHRSALQKVAGTLVSIAVDYFANTPGAVSESRPEGRALLGFLKAIDDVDFADTPAQDIAGDLLIAVLDSVANSPELLSGGEKEQVFIQNITKTLSESAKNHLAGAPVLEKREAAVWLQLVARAVVKGGAETVLANPVRFLGVDPGAQTNIIQEVGGTIADLVIGPEKLTFRPLLSGQGLNTIVKATLTAVANNPEIITVDNQGVKNIIVALAGELGQKPNLMTKDILPELVRLVLDKSADNMDLLWGRDFSDPDRHLLVTASRQLLKALATQPAVGTWRPTLTKSQVLDVANVVLDEVIDNPDWLITRAGMANPVLEMAITGILAALKKADGQRINAETGVAALKGGVSAVALNINLLEKLPPGGQDAGKVALTAAIDAIFGTVFANNVNVTMKWRFARNSTIQTLIAVGLDKLAQTGAEQKHIDVLRVSLTNLVNGTLELNDLPVKLEQELRAA